MYEVEARESTLAQVRARTHRGRESARTHPGSFHAKKVREEEVSDLDDDDESEEERTKRKKRARNHHKSSSAPEEGEDDEDEDEE